MRRCGERRHRVAEQPKAEPGPRPDGGAARPPSGPRRRLSCGDAVCYRHGARQWRSRLSGLGSRVRLLPWSRHIRSRRRLCCRPRLSVDFHAACPPVWSPTDIGAVVARTRFGLRESEPSDCPDVHRRSDGAAQALDVRHRQQDGDRASSTTQHAAPPRRGPRAVSAGPQPLDVLRRAACGLDRPLCGSPGAWAACWPNKGCSPARKETRTYAAPSRAPR